MLQIWSISAIVKRRFEFFGKNPPHSGIGATAHRWFDSGSMIERYSLPKMRSIWTEQRKLEIWLEIETLACEAMAELVRNFEGGQKGKPPLLNIII